MTAIPSSAATPDPRRSRTARAVFLPLPPPRSTPRKRLKDRCLTRSSDLAGKGEHRQRETRTAAGRQRAATSGSVDSRSLSYRIGPVASMAANAWTGKPAGTEESDETFPVQIQDP